MTRLSLQRIYTGTLLVEMDERIAKIEKEIAALGPVYLESFITRTGVLQEDEQDPNSKEAKNYGTVIGSL